MKSTDPLERDAATRIARALFEGSPAAVATVEE
jgi:hypothetical protein